MKTQLLCTFSHSSDLNVVIEYIQLKYHIPEKRIFVFSNQQQKNELYCTYNIVPQLDKGVNTINIHRKKETNTLYTVNALNELIYNANNGILDKTFQIDWMQYENSFILTTDTGYKVIPLIFSKKISW